MGEKAPKETAVGGVASSLESDEAGQASTAEVFEGGGAGGGHVVEAFAHAAAPDRGGGLATGGDGEGAAGAGDGAGQRRAGRRRIHH